MRNMENENYHFVSFLPDAQKKIPKKIKKLKIPLWIQFKPKLIAEGREREKIKIIHPLRSYPTRKKKNSQKNSKIIQQIIKYHYGFISSKNRMEKIEKQ